MLELKLVSELGSLFPELWIDDRQIDHTKSVPLTRAARRALNSLVRFRVGYGAETGRRYLDTVLGMLERERADDGGGRSRRNRLCKNFKRLSRTKLNLDFPIPLHLCLLLTLLSNPRC